MRQTQMERIHTITRDPSGCKSPYQGLERTILFPMNRIRDMRMHRDRLSHNAVSEKKGDRNDLKVISAARMKYGDKDTNTKRNILCKIESMFLSKR